MSDDPLGTSDRAWAWAKRLYLLSVLMYALLASVFVAMAWASTQSVTVPLPSKLFLAPPAGSSDAAAEQYFDYLHLQNIGNLGQNSGQNWFGLTEAMGFGAAFLIALYFLVFAWFSRRRSGDLYPVEVYNGYITERNGGVDPFNWAVYAIVLIYAIFYISVSLRFGQIY
jgi:hypothetical protein